MFKVIRSNIQIAITPPLIVRFCFKFYKRFGHTTSEVPQKFNVKGSKVKVTARRDVSKNLPNCE